MRMYEILGEAHVFDTFPKQLLSTFLEGVDMDVIPYVGELIEKNEKGWSNI